MKSPNRSESGFVLLYTVLALFLLAALILAGTDRSQALDRVASVRFSVDGQARQVARSGLIHALAWFRSQEDQPVKAFAPVRDLEADPPIDETEDPGIGLVRTFQIAPGVWGRYLVRHGADDEPFTDQNGNGYYDDGEPLEDLDGDGRRTMGYGVRDLSSRHGQPAGSVWRIECEGEVYERPRPDLPLGVEPNERLASITIAGNLTRAGFVVPGMAALITSEAEELKLKSSKAWIESPTLGVGYRDNTGAPQISDKTKIVAPTKHAAIPGLAEGSGPGGKKGKGDKKVTDPLQVEEIFGVDLQGMKAIADIVRDFPAKVDTKKEAPVHVPDGATVVVTAAAKKSSKTGRGKLKFDKKWPISGRGILIIDADVEIKEGCDFQGVIFITGDCKYEKSWVEGMLVVGGLAEIKGKSKKKSKKQGRQWDLLHNPDLVAALLAQSADYQPSRGWQPAPITTDGVPMEELLEEERGPSPDVTPDDGTASTPVAPTAPATPAGVPPGQSSVPPGLADKNGVPPGLADKNGVPPGQAKK